MKEKNKKILKSIGIGALACLGVFTFAGCSSILTDDQVEGMVATVEQSEQFMEDTIAQLKEQNELLQSQNSALAEQNEILSKKEFTKEEAYDLIRLIDVKFDINIDGIRENLKVIYNEDGNIYTGALSYYTDTYQIIMMTSSLGYKNAIYQEGDYVYACSFNNTGVLTSKVLLDDKNTNMEKDYTLGWKLFDRIESIDNIVNIETLDNGNYKIAFMIEVKEGDNVVYMQLYEMEINGSTLISIKTTRSGEILTKDYFEYCSPDSCEMTYTYGTVAEADVIDIVTAIKNA
ncbi:MAG: hypothetical protein E7351_00935 [Clostridiales bacterium]|nr:hypothetical protein [Clostridiales bacterium]